MAKLVKSESVAASKQSAADNWNKLAAHNLWLSLSLEEKALLTRIIEGPEKINVFGSDNLSFLGSLEHKGILELNPFLESKASEGIVMFNNEVGTVTDLGRATYQASKGPNAKAVDRTKDGFLKPVASKPAQTAPKIPENSGKNRTVPASARPTLSVSAPAPNSPAPAKPTRPTHQEYAAARLAVADAELAIAVLHCREHYPVRDKDIDRLARALVQKEKFLGTPTQD